MSVADISKNIANTFADIYGENSVESGRVLYLVKQGYYDLIKLVRLLRPDMLLSFCKSAEFSSGVPFPQISGNATWASFLEDVYDIFRISYSGIPIDRDGFDKIRYLNANKNSIFGGMHSPKFAFSNDFEDAERNIAFYPSSITDAPVNDDHKWEIYWIVLDLGMDIMHDYIKYAPRSLFGTVIKAAVVIQLTKDSTEAKRNFLLDLEDKKRNMDDAVDTLISAMITLTEESLGVDMEEEEYAPIRTLISEVNSALSNLTTYLDDEDVEMVEANARRIQSIVEKIRTEIQILSEKWSSFTGVRQLSVQASIGALNAISNMINGIQGSAIAFTEAVKHIDARKAELVEEIKVDIAGASL